MVEEALSYFLFFTRPGKNKALTELGQATRFTGDSLLPFHHTLRSGSVYERIKNNLQENTA